MQETILRCKEKTQETRNFKMQGKNTKETINYCTVYEDEVAIKIIRNK